MALTTCTLGAKFLSIMTQREIEKTLRMAKCYFNKILNAKKNASPELARKIQDLTGMDFTVFLKGVGTKAARWREWRKFQKRSAS